MKIIKAIKFLFEYIFFEHIALPIRMLFVYLIIRFFYVGVEKFNFKDEFNTGLSYFLIFIFIYGVTIVLNVKRIDSSPLVLSHYIEQTIKEDYRLTNSLVSKEKRGVFTNIQKVVGIQVINNFVFHENPSQIIEVTSSYIRILEGMQLPTHTETIKWLENLRDEARFMLYGE